MKLKELLSKIYEGDDETELTIDDNSNFVVEDVTIHDLPYGVYQTLKNREVKRFTALAANSIFIELDPD